MGFKCVVDVLKNSDVGWALPTIARYARTEQKNIQLHHQTSVGSAHPTRCKQ